MKAFTNSFLLLVIMPLVVMFGESIVLRVIFVIMVALYMLTVEPKGK